MRVALVALVLALSIGGCKDDPNATVCNHYAKLMVKCSEGDESKTLVEDTANNFCIKGMSGKHEQIFGAKYKTMIECTRTAETCEAFEKCKEP